MNLKKIFTLASTLGLLALVPLSAITDKIIVVNMQELVETYHKREGIMRALEQELIPEFRAVEGLALELERINADFEEARLGAQNNFVTEEVRARAQRNAQMLFQQRAQKAQQFEARRQQARELVSQKQSIALRGLYNEVARRTAMVARQKGATLLLDRSGVASQGVPTVLYADSALDITDEMKRILNEDAPQS